MHQFLRFTNCKEPAYHWTGNDRSIAYKSEICYCRIWPCKGVELLFEYYGLVLDALADINIKCLFFHLLVLFFLSLSLVIGEMLISPLEIEVHHIYWLLASVWAICSIHFTTLPPKVMFSPHVHILKYSGMSAARWNLFDVSFNFSRAMW